MSLQYKVLRQQQLQPSINQMFQELKFSISLLSLLVMEVAAEVSL